MSLTDKVIKNSFFYLTSQTVGFIFPLILTPFIISKIGGTQFGIYVIIMGFTGAFGVLDLSLSSSFIKFISEYYIKKNFSKLNSFINTGFIYYLAFSLAVGAAGFVFAENLIGIFNIPSELIDISVFAFRISIFTFVLSNITTVFTCILFSMHLIYKTSLIGILLHSANFVFIILLLNYGYGLAGLFYVQAGFALAIFILNFYIAKKFMPEFRLNFKSIDSDSFRKMFTYGSQIQVSRFSAILSEKLDEFLLGYYTIMTNVTFYNLAYKVTKAGRFFPLQFIPQIGSAAAELHAKEEDTKLSILFESFTRYMSILIVPFFIFIIFFSDFIITAWLGEGYEITSFILKILATAQLFNLVTSIPGNTILSGIGLPKYVMYEGLINLIINAVLSFILIRIYGITGAAFGTAIAMITSSLYIYYVSSKFFTGSLYQNIFNSFLLPVGVGSIIAAILYTAIGVFDFIPGEGRVGIILTLLVCIIIFISCYIWCILKLKILRKEDKELFQKSILKIPFIGKIFKTP
jgi:O-antigen/teichoic acid export membrane protein